MEVVECRVCRVFDSLFRTMYEGLLSIKAALGTQKRVALGSYRLYMT